MKRSRFSEEQIIGLLKEHEAGVLLADLFGKNGVSDASIGRHSVAMRSCSIPPCRLAARCMDRIGHYLRLPCWILRFGVIAVVQSA